MQRAGERARRRCPPAFAVADRSSPSTATPTPRTTCSRTCSRRHTPLEVARRRARRRDRRRPRPARAARLPPARRGPHGRAVGRRAGPVRAAVDRRAVPVGRRHVRAARGRRGADRRQRRRRRGARARSSGAAATRSCRTRRRPSGRRCRGPRWRPSPHAVLAARRDRRGALPASATSRARRDRDAPATSCSSTTGPENLLALEAVLAPLPCKLVSRHLGPGGAAAAAARRVRADPARRPDAGARRLRDRRVHQAPQAHADGPDHLRHGDLEGAPPRLPRLRDRRGRLRLQAVRPAAAAREGPGLPRPARGRPRQVHRSEELLRATFDCAPIGMARMDEDGVDPAGQPRAVRRCSACARGRCSGARSTRSRTPTTSSSTPSSAASCCAGAVDSYEVEKRLIDAHGHRGRRRC